MRAVLSLPTALASRHHPVGTIVYRCARVQASGILKGASSEPVRCRDKCAADATCDAATFRWSAGQCYLWALPQDYHAPASTCPRRKWWVGNTAGEGAVNYIKGVPNPPSPPPTPSPPPSPPPLSPPHPVAPPLWPPHAPLVSTPEYTWPVEWFGPFACHGRHAASAAVLDGCELTSDGKNPLGYQHVTPAEWVDDGGSVLGYDWSLPSKYTPVRARRPRPRAVARSAARDPRRRPPCLSLPSICAVRSSCAPL